MVYYTLIGFPLPIKLPKQKLVEEIDVPNTSEQYTNIFDGVRWDFKVLDNEKRAKIILSLKSTGFTLNDENFELYLSETSLKILYKNSTVKSIFRINLPFYIYTYRADSVYSSIQNTLTISIDLK